MDQQQDNLSLFTPEVLDSFFNLPSADTMDDSALLDMLFPPTNDMWSTPSPESNVTHTTLSTSISSKKPNENQVKIHVPPTPSNSPPCFESSHSLSYLSEESPISTSSTSPSPSSASSSASPTSSSPVSKTSKIPRPSNSFMTYRKEKHYEIIPFYQGVNNKEISKIIGYLWRNEPAEVKEYYRKKAEQGKVEHALRYPGYKYKPRKRRETLSCSRPVPVVSTSSPYSIPATSMSSQRQAKAQMITSNANAISMPLSGNYSSSTQLGQCPLLINKSFGDLAYLVPPTLDTQNNAMAPSLEPNGVMPASSLSPNAFLNCWLPSAPWSAT